MAQHAQLRIDTGLEIYFCDPLSPWQRGTNENTNGLLRQYFPKGTDLARHSPDDLAAVAAALNGRPRKTLGWKTPAEALDEFLYSCQQGSVATTLEPKVGTEIGGVTGSANALWRRTPGGAAPVTAAGASFYAAALPWS